MLTWNQNTLAVGTTPVSYGTLLFSQPGSLPVSPAVFGTTDRVAAVQSYEFLYAPNLYFALDDFTAAKTGPMQRLETLFLTYQYFRVAKLTVIFERTGKPPLIVQDVGLGGSNPTQNIGTSGAEGYFMVARYGNSYHSVRPPAGTATWTAQQMLLCNAFYQMENDYPRMRKCMRHVRDMNRTKRMRFSFAPTVTTPEWVTGFDDTSLGNTSAQTRYRPNTGLGGEFQPQRYKRFPWLPTIWKNNVGSAADDVFKWTMWGISGALKPGSWGPGNWSSWTMKSVMTLRFKKKLPEGLQSFGTTQPMISYLNRWMQNSSYNLPV